MGKGGRRRLRISAGASFLIQFAASMTYAGLVVASAQAPGSNLADVLDGWRRLLRPAMTPFFVFVGPPPCSPLGVSAHVMRLYDVYIQLVVVELALASAWFVVCSMFWGFWAEQLLGVQRWAGASPQQREREVQIWQAVMLFATGAVAWASVAYDRTFSSPGCGEVSAWAFLRAPLVIAVIYGLSCFAAAFGAARREAWAPPAGH